MVARGPTDSDAGLGEGVFVCPEPLGLREPFDAGTVLHPGSVASCLRERVGSEFPRDVGRRNLQRLPDRERGGCALAELLGGARGGLVSELSEAARLFACLEEQPF